MIKRIGTKIFCLIMAISFIMAYCPMMSVYAMDDPDNPPATDTDEPTEDQEEEENTDYKYDNPKYSRYRVTKVDEKGTHEMYTASDERRAACRKMNRMANVSWTVPAAFRYEYANDKKIKLKEDITYYGLPYTQFNRIYHGYGQDVVQQRMNDASAKTDVVKGVDCSSAVAYALRVGNGMEESTTYLMGSTKPYVTYSYLFDGMRDSSGTDISRTGKIIIYRDDLHYVGWYGKYKDCAQAATTTEIAEKLVKSYPKGSGDIYSNVYAKVRPGDVILRINDVDGHVLLATGVKVVYKDGKIDPDKSKVLFTDQNHPEIRMVKTEGWSSSWRRNYNGPNASFSRLKSLGYLPITAYDMGTTFKISYSAKGAVGKPDKQIKNIYESIKLSDAVPEKAGYTFVGWKPKNDPIERIYKPGAYYNEDMDETLIAVWEKTPEEEPVDPGEGEEQEIVDVPAKSIKVILSKKSFVYNGKVRKPALVVKCQGETLEPDQYKVTYDKGRKAVGSYGVTATLKGSLRGSKTVYFTIKPKKVTGLKITSPKAKQIKITYSAATGGVKYQIAYRLKGKSKWIKVYDKDNKRTLKSLKAAKTYQVKVRAYKKVKDKVYYGSWSKIKSVTTRR